jgi:hypothetical protein
MRGRRLSESPENLVTCLLPIDLQAFRNLLDPDEEDFLRATLSSEQFRTIQRERLRAAVDYVRAVSKNAALLVHVGQAAMRATDPNLATAGQLLFNSALQLRLQALGSTILLYLRMAVPSGRLWGNKLADRYERLRNLTSQLKVVQMSGHPA